MNTVDKNAIAAYRRIVGPVAQAGLNFIQSEYTAQRLSAPVRLLFFSGELRWFGENRCPEAGLK